MNSLAFGQTVSKHNIKTNLLNLPFKAWNLQYEYLMKYHSLQVSYTRLHDSPFINSEMYGHLLNVEYRIYLHHEKNFTGSYLSPYMRWQNVFIENNDNDVIQINHVGAGFLLGKVVHPFRIERLILDYFIGVNYIPKKYEEITSPIVTMPNTHDFPLSPTIYGLGVRAGISLGVRF
jgi:hypothetical protein